MTVAFAGDLKLTLNSDGSVTITQKGESWGDPWPTQDSSITIRNLEDFQSCFTSLKNSRSYNTW